MYVAPELSRARGPVDPEKARSPIDSAFIHLIPKQAIVYSLGITLFECAGVAQKRDYNSFTELERLLARMADEDPYSRVPFVALFMVIHQFTFPNSIGFVIEQCFMFKVANGLNYTEILAALVDQLVPVNRATSMRAPQSQSMYNPSIRIPQSTSVYNRTVRAVPVAQQSRKATSTRPSNRVQFVAAQEALDRGMLFHMPLSSFIYLLRLSKALRNALSSCLMASASHSTHRPLLESETSLMPLPLTLVLLTALTLVSHIR